MVDGKRELHPRWPARAQWMRNYERYPPDPSQEQRRSPDKLGPVLPQGHAQPPVPGDLEAIYAAASRAEPTPGDDPPAYPPYDGPDTPPPEYGTPPWPLSGEAPQILPHVEETPGGPAFFGGPPRPPGGGLPHLGRSGRGPPGAPAAHPHAP